MPPVDVPAMRSKYWPMPFPSRCSSSRLARTAAGKIPLMPPPSRARILNGSRLSQETARGVGGGCRPCVGAGSWVLLVPYATEVRIAGMRFSAYLFGHRRRLLPTRRDVARVARPSQGSFAGRLCPALSSLASTRLISGRWDSSEDTRIFQMRDDVLARALQGRGEGLFPGHHPDGVVAFDLDEQPRHVPAIGVAHFLVGPASGVEVLGNEPDEDVHGVQGVEYLVLPQGAGCYVLVGDEATQSLALDLLTQFGDWRRWEARWLRNTSFLPW